MTIRAAFLFSNQTGCEAECSGHHEQEAASAKVWNPQRGQEGLELHPDYATLHTKLALVLAACPRDELRDGQQALVHAQRGCELTGWKDEPALRVLAIAYAETGQFDEAIRWAQEGLKIDPSAARNVNELLALFQMRKPYRLAGGPAGGD
jgi:tetratricopeptide (TPR) repeat protein